MLTFRATVNMELSHVSLKEVLRSYSSIKGRRTWCECEIANLLELLNAQYSSTSETRINDRLGKLEKHSHKLMDIANYLASIKYAKARDDKEEVDEFMDTLDKRSSFVFITT